MKEAQRTIAVLALLALRPAARADDALVVALTARNAAAEQRFEAEATAAHAEAEERERETARVTQTNAAIDKRAAEEYSDAKARARQRARRKTALVLGTFALGFGAAGIGAAVLAEQQDASIAEGGFASAQDIANADRLGRAYYYTALGCGAASTVFAAIAIPLAFSGGPPERETTFSVGANGVQLQGRF